MNAFDDYPELMATGSAISLIASVGEKVSGLVFQLNSSGWRKSLWSGYLWVRLSVLVVSSGG